MIIKTFHKTALIWFLLWLIVALLGCAGEKEKPVDMSDYEQAQKILDSMNRHLDCCIEQKVDLIVILSKLPIGDREFVGIKLIEERKIKL